MTTLRIYYPCMLLDEDEPFEEELTGEQVRPGVYRLTSFSTFVPLAPGDEVRATDGLITDVERLADVYLVEAFFRLNTSLPTVEAAEAQWRQSTEAIASTALTIRVACTDAGWIRRVVQGHPKVTMVDLLRTPGDKIDFHAEVDQI